VQRQANRPENSQIHVDIIYAWTGALLALMDLIAAQKFNVKNAILSLVNLQMYFSAPFEAT
jgi:hypothetical protein